MKITAKTTKEQLKDFLVANVKAVKKADKGLFDRIAYADKMSKTDDTKVSRKDLSDLAKEVIKLLGDKVATPVLAEEKTPVENSVKKLGKGVSKKQEVAQDVEGESLEAEKTAKKSLGKKKEPKEGVVALDNTNKTIQMADTFPKTIEVGDAKYELAEDINTIDDLYNALAKDEEIVFAYYWSKRHLRQFDYFSRILGQPTSFDLDLDLASAMYVSDEKKICYQVSLYTEALYATLPKDFENTDGIRVAGGVEYQIYRKIND